MNTGSSCLPPLVFLSKHRGVCHVEIRQRPNSGTAKEYYLGTGIYGHGILRIQKWFFFFGGGEGTGYGKLGIEIYKVQLIVTGNCNCISPEKKCNNIPPSF